MPSLGSFLTETMIVFFAGICGTTDARSGARTSVGGIFVVAFVPVLQTVVGGLGFTCFCCNLCFLSTRNCSNAVPESEESLVRLLAGICGTTETLGPVGWMTSGTGFGKIGEYGGWFVVGRWTELDTMDEVAWVAGSTVIAVDTD